MSGEAERLGGIFLSLKQNDCRLAPSVSASAEQRDMFPRVHSNPPPSLSIHNYLTNPYGSLLMAEVLKKLGEELESTGERGLVWKPNFTGSE